MKKFKIDKWAIIITLVIVLALSIYIVLLPEQATSTLNNLRVFTTSKMGFYFVLITIGIFAVNISLAFSKYGNIKLGKGDPNYKTFSWIAMIFCATMGTSILYWATLEWVYYYTGPPMGLDPQSMAAAEVAVSYSFFHWGIPAWGIYAIGTIPIAYRYYIRQKDGLSLAGGCEGVTGGKPVWNKIINIVFIFGIVSGIIISFGTGIPMLVNNLHNSVGTPDTFIMQVIMVVVVTFIFTLSSYAGLDKGMKFCSDSTTYLFFILLAFVFIFGNPLFQIENTIKSLGLMINNFVPMIFETEPIVKTGFTADWTVFYWAWWITLAPWMWIFIAKISKGRTIKEVILCITGAGMLSTLLFFGVLSNYGLQLQLTGSFNFVEILQTQSPEQVISTVIAALPLGKIVLLVWFLTGTMLLITTLDSAVFTLSAASIKNIKDDEIPPNHLKLFWAIVISAIPLCLMFAKAPLDSLKSAIIISALPVSVTLILCVVSLYKWMKKDFGSLTRAQIIEKEKDPTPDFEPGDFTLPEKGKKPKEEETLTE
ncbi:BCCT family transporter [Eubacterium limosum]|uniref:BCCT family transporter n=1 Tax=Eubacterium limosum TaxID=1736 RepID=UPI000D70C5DE|nr:BCCT family transporter [Eubacterium limosum]PWW53898.1 BCCT family betaine/carnitine transporter [Eubacterium limosum]